MPVKKSYSTADVKSAIEMSNKQYFGLLLRVRNDLTNDQMSGGMIDDEDDPHSYRGRGSDVGHAFRHVEGTSLAGKSTFKDSQSMYRAVAYLLNTDYGQTKLGELDTANPFGDERGYNGASAITATISRSVKSLNVYGKTQGGSEAKVKKAMCIVQKIGESNLWVHTAYPTSFC